MKKGDLVHFRNQDFDNEIGLIIEIQTRGPLPGAYVLWPGENEPKWVKMESLSSARESTSR